MKRCIWISFLSAGCLAVIGCGGGSSGGNPDAGQGGNPDGGGGNTGTYYHYVSNRIQVPVTTNEVTAFGFDLDGDPNGRIDNALGSLLATLADPSNGVDIQGPLGDLVNTGALVILHSVRADSLTTDASASWQVYFGDQTATPPLFDQNDVFTVAATSPTDAKMQGTIAGGQYAGGPAAIQLQLSIVQDQPPILVHLIGAQLQADITANGCTNGKLGGGITSQEMNSQVLPTLATIMNGRVVDDPGCLPGAATTPPDLTGCDTSTKTILTLFDKHPQNGEITLEEVLQNAFVQTILTPDVDLLDDPDGDGVGTFSPRTDGVDDSVSLGIGFTCIKAGFLATGEST